MNTTAELLTPCLENLNARVVNYTTEEETLPDEPFTEVLPELLSARQVARLLSISVRTVWRLLERGVLPRPVRFNSKLVRWFTADVLAFVEDLRQHPERAVQA